MEKDTNRSSRLMGVGMVLLLVALFFILNLCAQHFLSGRRIDLSSDQRFTLSSGTQSILGTLEEPVTLRFYFSRQLAQKSPVLINYANRVLDMLKEYARLGGDKVILKIIEPAPFSELEDQAVDFGLQGLPIDEEGTELFFGLVATNSTTGILTIPFFQNQREPFLEYDISQLLYQLAHPKLPVIAAISSLPVQGHIGFMTQEMKPWVVWDQISSVFETRIIQASVNHIDDDVDVLMLIQPQGLSPETLNAIDQFVMRGGRILGFLDPYSEVLNAASEQPSSLAPLLKAWGVNFNPVEAVAFRDAANRVRYTQDNRDMVDPFPLWMTLDHNYLSQEDMATAQLQNLILASAGYFTPTSDAKTHFAPLIQIKQGVMTVKADAVESYRKDPKSLLREYNPQDGTFTLGVRLTGKIPSAFQANKSVEKGNIMLIAESDFLYDDFWVQVQSFMGNYFAVPMSGNGHFVLGALENLTGNNDLISIRNRTNFNRPFEKIQALQTNAEIKFRDQEAALMSQLETTKQKLLDLDGEKEGSNALSLSAAQQATAAQFRQEMVETRKQLRQVRHDLKKDIDKLENNLKFFNIFFIPLLVCVFGALLSLWYFKSYPKRLAKKLQGI